MDAFIKWRPAIATKALENGETQLYAFVPDILPMIADRSVDDEVSAVEIEDIKTNGGDECSGYLDITESIIAEYIGRSNMSPPDIHKGEMVLISESIKGIFYWRELGINDYYRLVEKTTFRVANKNITIEDLSEENTYYLTLDSINKNITLATTKKAMSADKHSYEFKLDTANSKAYLTDSDNNKIIMDSKVPSITTINKNGTMFEVNKDDINMFAPNNFNIEVGNDFNIDVGNCINVNSPLASCNVGITTLTGTDLNITESTSAVITSPIAAINGMLNVSVSILTNLVASGVLSAGASASVIQGATISGSSGSPSGATPPLPGEPPTDLSASYNQLVIMMEALVSAITSLGSAITAANSAHAGAATAPAGAVEGLVTAANDNATIVTDTLPTAKLPKIEANNG